MSIARSSHSLSKPRPGSPLCRRLVLDVTLVGGMAGVGRACLLVDVQFRRGRRLQYLFGAFDLVRRTMRQDQEVLRPYGFLITNDGILRNPDAHEGAGQSAQAPNQQGALGGSYEHRGQVPQNHHGSDQGQGHEDTADEETPEPAPEGSGLPPELYPVPDVVEADDLFVGVVPLPDDGQLGQREIGLAKGANRLFGLVVAAVYGDGDALFGHVLVPCPKVLGGAVRLPSRDRNKRRAMDADHYAQGGSDVIQTLARSEIWRGRRGGLWS